ncbi:proteasome subunit beta type-3-B-like [Salvia miltiorrhiza]|uniref:proteasome subunit beta type-3-B-like n=1 Tax=Salvia miltiorrhiza TaxID=226208 RepID=UPI0025AD7F5D|nr:proteasome subunit beta type-3-B-like [Salvia miltiorrhiza]XP_057773427.1 proteasome subunit beta type-3-B-like [Salvia miltiorrhiza]
MKKDFTPRHWQPVIAGLGDDGKPFICTMDSIGAKELAKDFVVSGSAFESLYGACESMFKPDMNLSFDAFHSLKKYQVEKFVS